MNLLQAFGQGQAAFRAQYVSPSAQALYYGLISTMNDNGWKDGGKLIVKQDRLVRIGNLPLRSAIKKYVNELVIAGLISIKVFANDDIESPDNGKIAIALLDKNAPKRAYKKRSSSNSKQQQAQLALTGVAQTAEVTADD